MNTEYENDRVSDCLICGRAPGDGHDADRHLAWSAGTGSVANPGTSCRAIPQPLGDEEVLVCERHGGFWTRNGCLTTAVLRDVADHRAFQFGEYGPNRDVPDGTGPDSQWLKPIVAAVGEFPNDVITAREAEELFREEWDHDVDPDPAKITWVRMVREEVAEAFAADPLELEGELIQVAALCVSWIEKIRERSA